MTPVQRQPLGLILAGGRSSRMGLDRPKPVLDVGGRSMVHRVADRLRPFVDRLVVATDRPELYAELGADLVFDEVPGYAGPLAGLQAGALHALASDDGGIGVVSAPADTPFLPDDLVPRLLAGAGADDVRVASLAGRLHPVCAFWPTSALTRLARLRLEADRAPSLHSVLPELGFAAVPFPSTDLAPGGDPFFNVNTPSDLETARSFAVSRGRRGYP